jgi:membrane-bound acyltransferase YfiQ involved in biofilm formation
MNYVRFFNSLFLGAVITLPVMVMAGKEVDELDGLDDFIWIPIMIALLALFMKTVIEKKQK